MARPTFRLSLALVAALTLTGRVQASALQSYFYNTDGNIGGPSSTNPAYPIALYGQQDTNVLGTPGSFTLGSISTSPLPPGATVSYANTPFEINLNVGAIPTGLSPNPGYYGAFPFSPTYFYHLTGVLNGSMDGSGVSSVVPTITAITGSGTTPPFPIEDLKFSLLPIVAPDGANYGHTLLTASVDVTGNPLPSPAPEPTSVAAFAAAIAGWVWKRRRLAARTASS